MADERLFIVTYDISDQKRWRRVFKAMHGYGEWYSFPFSSVVSRSGAAPSLRRDCASWSRMARITSS